MSENSKEVSLFSKDPEVQEWSLNDVLRGLNQFGGLMLFLLGIFNVVLLSDFESGTYYIAAGIFLTGIGGGFR